jgi:hypothetical protein
MHGGVTGKAGDSLPMSISLFHKLLVTRQTAPLPRGVFTPGIQPLVWVSGTESLTRRLASPGAVRLPCLHRFWPLISPTKTSEQRNPIVWTPGLEVD